MEERLQMSCRTPNFPMNTYRLSLSLLLASLTLSAEQVLTGIVNVDGKSRITIKELTTGAESDWLEQGSSYGGYVIVAIQPKESQAVLEKDGVKITLKLQDSRVQSAKFEEVKAPSEALDKLSNDELHVRGLHRIGMGESGARIAKSLGVTLADLRDANPGVNWARLHIGQVIRLKPATGAAEAKP